eukprot:UN29653
MDFTKIRNKTEKYKKSNNSKNVDNTKHEEKNNEKVEEKSVMVIEDRKTSVKYEIPALEFKRNVVTTDDGLADVLEEINVREWKEIMRELDDILARYVDQILFCKFASKGTLSTTDPVEMYRILGRTHVKQFIRDFKRGCLVFWVGNEKAQYFGSQKLCSIRSSNDNVKCGNVNAFIEFLRKKIFHVETFKDLTLKQKICLNYIFRLISQGCVALPLKLLQGYFAVHNDGVDLFGTDKISNYTISPEADYPGGSTQFDFIFSDTGSPQLFTP